MDYVTVSKWKIEKKGERERESQRAWAFLWHFFLTLGEMENKKIVLGHFFLHIIYICDALITFFRCFFLCYLFCLNYMQIEIIVELYFNMDKVAQVEQKGRRFNWWICIILFYFPSKSLLSLENRSLDYFLIYF